MGDFLCCGQSPVPALVAAGRRWAEGGRDGQPTMLGFGRAASPKVASGAWSFDLDEHEAPAAWHVLHDAFTAGQMGSVVAVEKSPGYAGPDGNTLHHFMVFSSDWGDKVRRNFR